MQKYNEKTTSKFIIRMKILILVFILYCVLNTIYNTTEGTYIYMRIKK